MGVLILLRHGESMWNKKNVFTGWVDVPLSKGGVDEALRAGERIKDLPIDHIFTTPLIRASATAMLVMSVHSSGKTPVNPHTGEGKMAEWGKIHSDKMLQEVVPVTVAWQLNERMYGALQGMNKDEMREIYGKEQVHIWRRSFDTAPPEGESLKMTAERAIPYFKENVEPLLESGKNVLISADGNSLRSIVMALEGLSGDEVVKLELATGDPRIYNYSDGTYTRQ